MERGPVGVCGGGGGEGGGRPGYAAAHPELVAAVMQSAALDFAAGLIARSPSETLQSP